MAKKSTKYVCAECGYETARWMGKCPACNAWNTFEEMQAAPALEEKKLKRKPGGGTDAVRVDEIPDEGAARLTTGIGELDRVLGGGAVEGSMMLVGGEPGIGKSTLLTQVSANMARDGWKVLYVSGEESARQIKMRAKRLKLDDSGFMVLSENDMNAIDAQIDAIKPDVLIADSVQTMYLPELSGAPGSVSQVRESAALLMRKAKADNICVFLVGHVTKEGAIAGPRILEHMVDAVLYFEGDGEHQYRLLRAVKNRFGSVNEIGMFEMTGDGMREVPNPSEALLNERAHGQSGSCVNCAMEGSRALLVDVQALVATTAFGNPRRMSSGVDQGRMALLLAVMEKRAGLPLYNKDVYVNIAGGMSLNEPAADLAICAAIASGHKNIALDGRWAVMGEVGLAGEVRAVSHADRRLGECARMGFTDVVLPKGNLRALSVPEGLRVHGVDTVAQAFYKLFQTEVGE